MTFIKKVQLIINNLKLHNKKAAKELKTISILFILERCSFYEIRRGIFY